MTPSENTQLAAFRTEVTEEFAALRSEFAPALELYRDLAAIGKFIKWGAGIGASIVTLVGGLKVLGLF